jgi:hypothetical protein
LIYAALVVLTTFSFAPSLASAQMAQGRFTLRHDVRWQNANVPAGDYRFSYDPNRPLGVLVLTRMSGARAGFVIMVPDTDTMQSSGESRLMLNTSASGTYVTDMLLPDSGVTLHFRTPRSAEKQIAKTATTPTEGAQ